MPCEMCGQEAPLYKAEVEGTTLNVCKKCAKYGKILQKPQQKNKKKKEKTTNKQTKTTPEPEEPVKAIIPDYPQKIKKAREKKGLKQEELAQKINEKNSLIHKLETGHFEPNLKLAQKISQFLNIKLIEKREPQKTKIKKKKEKSSSSLTIGDLIDHS